MSPDARKLTEIASGQRGLFTRAQAGDCGYSDYQVRRRIQVGEWHVVLGPVLAARSAVATPQLFDLAAGLAVPGAVLAGPSAARWHGFLVNDGRTWIAVPMSAHPRLPAVRLLRGTLPTSDVLSVAGFHVTSRPRTVFDCLRVLPDRAAMDLLDRALQRKWITMTDLVSRVQSFTGRRGVVRLTRFVAEAGSGARSAAERLAIDLLRAADIGGWEANVPIYDGVGELMGSAILSSARPGSSSNWMGGPTTSVTSGSSRTGTGRTGWSGRAGRCCGSPGGTGPAGRAMSSRRSGGAPTYGRSGTGHDGRRGSTSDTGTAGRLAGPRPSVDHHDRPAHR